MMSDSDDAQNSIDYELAVAHRLPGSGSSIPQSSRAMKPAIIPEERAIITPLQRVGLLVKQQPTVVASMQNSLDCFKHLQVRSFPLQCSSSFDPPRALTVCSFRRPVPFERSGIHLACSAAAREIMQRASFSSVPSPYAVCTLRTLRSWALTSAALKRTSALLLRLEQRHARRVIAVGSVLHA